MSTPPEELASLYVLDQLAPGERIAFESKLAADPDLATAVRRLEDALERRVRELPQHPPAADLFAALERRIELLPAEAGVSAKAAARRWSSMMSWGIAAAILLGVGALAFRQKGGSAIEGADSGVIMVGMNSSGSTFTELPWREGEPAKGDRFIRLAALAEKFWVKPGEIAALASSSSADLGYAIFDRGTNQGFVAVERLPPVENGRRYHLWVTEGDSGEAREAGIIPVNGSQRGLFSFAVDTAAGGPLRHPEFFVTAEDASAGDLATPRGKVVLGSKRT